MASEYNLDLTLEHSYLGSDLVDLHGRTILDDDITHKIVIFKKKVTLIPGQTLPLVIYHRGGAEEKRVIESKVFGVLYPQTDTYGTLAEVRSYKENVAQEGALRELVIKAEGRQRFKVLEKEDISRTSLFAKVRLLPDINLTSPERHLLLEGGRLPRLMSNLSSSPSFAYDSCNNKNLIRDIKKMIGKHAGEIPPVTDFVTFSYWLTATLPLNDDERQRLLGAYCVQDRLRMVKLLLSQNYNTIVCATCFTPKAVQSEIFNMWKVGSQGVFVNPAGVVHEMVTVRKMIEDSITYVGATSDQYSWFPGYAWTVIECARCSHFLGWRFQATADMEPNEFWGLTRREIRFGMESDESIMRTQDRLSSMGVRQLLGRRPRSDEDDDVLYMMDDL